MKNSRFQLLGRPRLKDLSFKLNENFNFEEDLNIEISNEVKIMKSNVQDEYMALVILELTIFKDVVDAPFDISTVIEGRFSWDEEIDSDDELLEIMLNRNAPAVLYSYVRPLISTLTVEANMPPLVLPLMNFHE